MSEKPDHISLKNSIVTRIPWYRVLINTMTDRFRYNPFRNGFLWIGFFWGLPIPILFLGSQSHSHRRTDHLDQRSRASLFPEPPLLFAFVFGIAGSVIRHYVRRLHDESIKDYLTGVYNYLAELLENLSRTSDIVFRYGGEEFAILLPETSIDDAFTLAERIRKSVAEHDFEINQRVTISGGVAEYPTSPIENSDLIQVVDELLYRAKEQGRNRIVSKKNDPSPLAC